MFQRFKSTNHNCFGFTVAGYDNDKEIANEYESFKYYSYIGIGSSNNILDSKSYLGADTEFICSSNHNIICGCIKK